MTIHDNAVPAIDCVDFVRLVDDLVDSDPAQWGPIVAKHLDECPPCLVYLQQMVDLKVLLNHVFEGRSSARSTSRGPQGNQRLQAGPARLAWAKALRPGGWGLKPHDRRPAGQ